MYNIIPYLKTWKTKKLALIYWDNFNQLIHLLDIPLVVARHAIGICNALQNPVVALIN